MPQLIPAIPCLVFDVRTSCVTCCQTLYRIYRIRNHSLLKTRYFKGLFAGRQLTKFAHKQPKQLNKTS